MYNLTLFHSKRKHILFATVILTCLWLFLLYGRTLVELTPVPIRWIWGVMGPLYLTTDFLNPLFASSVIFIGSYILGLGLILFAAKYVVQCTKHQRLLFLFGCLALLFPLIMPLTYGGNYKVPARAAAGYEMLWATKPRNMFSHAYKQAQILHEGQCDYTLVGWVNDEILNYHSACWPGTYQFDVRTGKRGWSLTKANSVDWDTESVRRWDGWQYLRQPTSLKSTLAYPFITLEWAKSPDGLWNAIVVRRIYGPSDVVIVRRIQ